MISMFTGRKCRGKCYIKDSFQEFDNGVFLGFGINYEEFDAGPAQYTTAIVELEDGQVIVTVPEDIQFINKKRIIPEKPLAGSVGVSESPDDEIPFDDKKDAERSNEEARKATKQKKRERVDHGKIRALKNAGWSNKDIADEMHMTPNAVANSLSTHKELIEELKRI